jgi:imidazolonepropionase-like amidohydrolase
VREGMSTADAFALVTSVPAKLWGLEGQVGTLVEGAFGNLTLMSGDPLAADSKVLHVWLRGNKVYDRAKDQRLQRLLEGSNQ